MAYERRHEERRKTKRPVKIYARKYLRTSGRRLADRLDKFFKSKSIKYNPWRI